MEDTALMGYFHFIRYLHEITSPKIRFIFEIFCLVVISLFLSTLFVMHNQYVGKSDCIQDMFMRSVPKSRFDILTIEIKNEESFIYKDNIPFQPVMPKEEDIKKRVNHANHPLNHIKIQQDVVFRKQRTIAKNNDNSNENINNNNNNDILLTTTTTTNNNIKNKNDKDNISIIQKIFNLRLLSDPIHHIPLKILDSIFPNNKKQSKGNINTLLKKDIIDREQDDNDVNQQQQGKIDSSTMINHKEEEQQQQQQQQDQQQQDDTHYIDEFNDLVQYFLINTNPRYEFSYQKAFLLMTPELRTMYNISTHHIDIYTNETCLGNPFHKMILKILGYDIVMINNIVNSFMGKGYMKIISDNNIFNLANYSSPDRELSTEFIFHLIQKFLLTNLIFFSTTIIFGTSLRICEFCISRCFDHNPRQFLSSMAHNCLVGFIFILIQIGYISIFSVFLSTEYLVFLMSSLITSYFSTWGLRSKESIKYYPVLFLAVLYLLVFYIVTFPTGFHPIAFYSCYSIIEYLLILCLFNFEIPAVLENRIIRNNNNNNNNDTTNNINNQPIIGLNNNSNVVNSNNANANSNIISHQPIQLRSVQTEISNRSLHQHSSLGNLINSNSIPFIRNRADNNSNNHTNSDGESTTTTTINANNSNGSINYHHHTHHHISNDIVDNIANQLIFNDNIINN
ncbi:hypothetical protein CYY_006290 [Polysphondylium violaceum]|uniref:Uncharacterized protein n=1 Tax=Polysphondylium violaceum TaxID=133409 RepID=A0A8J4PRL3_9MYCE|nr:hypothetical protein CYY_006290 [Polysphondylium violaceum]